MIYRFLDCEMNVARHVFRRAGVETPLEPQVFDLLHLLLRRAGDLVSRDDLVEEIWSGRAVSEATIAARISLARQAVGDNGKAQRVIRTAQRRGIRLICPVDAETGEPPQVPQSAPASQRVRFARSGDGAALAWATTGSGPPLLRGSHWLTHLELDWRSPVWKPFLEELGRNFSVTRWDQRGTGLSTRDVDAFDLDRLVDDMVTVADAACLNRFPVFAASQAVPVAIAFAVQHPHRISRLVLYGGFAVGRAVQSDPEALAQGEAMKTLVRAGWGHPESAFMQAFSTMFMPEATDAQLDAFVRMQRASASAETAALLREAIASFDVENMLSRVLAPTLVIHARNDTVQPLVQAQRLAVGIPGAELLVLESRNHIPLPQNPAWSDLIGAVRSFLA